MSNRSILSLPPSDSSPLLFLFLASHTISAIRTDSMIKLLKTFYEDRRGWKHPSVILSVISVWSLQERCHDTALVYPSSLPKYLLKLLDLSLNLEIQIFRFCSQFHILLQRIAARFLSSQLTHWCILEVRKYFLRYVISESNWHTELLPIAPLCVTCKFGLQISTLIT